MPYFLVTHTSLIEADDETQAAQKAIAKIKAGQGLAFDVRFDQNASKHVKVSASDIGIIAPEPAQEHPDALAAPTRGADGEELVFSRGSTADAQQTAGIKTPAENRACLRLVSLFLAGMISGGALAWAYPLLSP